MDSSEIWGWVAAVLIAAFVMYNIGHARGLKDGKAEERAAWDRLLKAKQLRDEP